ncbi:MAG: DUF1015 family protein, partial [Candidatus Aegiribacteria sp.]|nr:DUF1015 family protein [Candidatus Aegiribacteria sp.]MBD3294542.1 DUF1015 family protein [Candidatus Fermentibacteria bacterium]
MVTVRPFNGLRPARKLAEKIASPPYDVLDSDEAREIVKENPLSFLRVVKPEVDLDPSLDLYDTRVYEQGAFNLRHLMEHGEMIQEKKPMFYLYRQVMGDHSQVGLVATVSADDYEKNLIKKHEHTRKAKEEDRIRHIETQNAQCGPVFLTYHDQSEFDEIQQRICGREEPEYDFESPDNIRHTLWLVKDDEDIESINRLFQEVPALYVADGHHRSAAGTIVARRRRESNENHTGNEEYNYFLAVLFPKSQMKIMAYNRVVADLNGLSKEEFLKRISDNFEVSDKADPKPGKRLRYSMYLDGSWYGLEPKEGSFPADDPVLSLDASILQENLLDPLLGIDDPRTSERIKFVGGIRGTEELEKLVDNGGFSVAFSLYPTSIDQLMNVADSGRVMPPKSTWFEPKLRS